ncbi:hypothetical protein [Saccharothrix sp. Mg75]|uniref:hypothetical protein n=1 Tax=Saccharothrix sp. Mg75 TaxID=3445357 RepID=UPI003EEA67DE
MIQALSTALTVLGLVAGTWSLVLVVADKPITLATKATLGLAGVVVLLEAGLLVQFVAGVVRAIGLDREIDTPTFIGYLLTAVLILPLGAFWSLAERSRWGAGVLAVALFSVPAMVLRANQVWGA